MVDKPIPVICTAIVGLVILELGAMHYGINGTFRTMVFAAIAGLAGWALPQAKIAK